MAKCLRVVADDRILWTVGDEERAFGGTECSKDDNASPPTTTRISSTLTASAFLKSSPSGAYTTARTSAQGTRVFDLSRHIERLSESASLLGGGGGGNGSGGGEKAPLPPPPRSLREPSLLRPRVLSLLRLGLLLKKEEKREDGSVFAPDPALGGHRGEFRVTILAVWSGGGGGEEGEGEEGEESPSFSLSLHVAPLPPPPPQPVVALILGGKTADSSSNSSSAAAAGGRHRAAAKSTSWVSERAALEAAGREAGAEEVLLVEREGEGGEGGGGKEILEGLSSNFAAVVPLPSDAAAASDTFSAAPAAAAPEQLYGTGFELQTAGDGRVLSGTVRGLLLEVAASAGFRVSDARCPSVEDARLARWSGCLLLSTSRLALPVAELREEKRKAEAAAEPGEEEEEEEGSDKKGKEEEEESGATATATSLIASFVQGGGKFHPVVERLSREVAAAVEGASESIC